MILGFLTYFQNKFYLLIRNCFTTLAIFRSKIILLLLLLIGVRCARQRESENTLSVQRPQPHITNPWNEEKDKTVGYKKERADHANRKALALLLKSASPTPLNTASLKSFQRDTERGTKLLRYWKKIGGGGWFFIFWLFKSILFFC